MSNEISSSPVSLLASRYIERQVDRELFRLLLDGRSCHVQAPRQTGKSALRANTAVKLQQKGITTVEIDLNQLGTKGTTEDQWCLSLCELLSKQLGWESVTGWVELGTTGTDRLCRTLHRLVQREPMVIFLDEADLFRSLSFGPKTLVALFIESVHGLTWCSLGACDLDDIVDRRELSRPVDRLFLHDFSRHELVALSPDLAKLEVDTEELFERIYEFTAGHPAMTKRLCEALMENSAGASVEELATKLFLRTSGTGEPSVIEIKRYLEASGRTYGSAMLRVYEQLLAGTAITFDQSMPVHRSLVTCGLVSCRQGEQPRLLVPRNRVIASVFNEAWVRFELLLAPSAPTLPLLADYDWAVIHVAWDETEQRRQLLFAMVELLPREVLPPFDDGEQMHRLNVDSTHVVRVRHSVLPARAALDWYRNCATSCAPLPGDLLKHGDQRALPTLDIAALREEPPWPNLICENVPYQACWHLAPRMHHLIPTNFSPEWTEDEWKSAEEWLSGRLHSQFTKQSNLWGSVHLVAPSPVFRYFGDRLDPDRPGADAIHYYCIVRTGQRLADLIVTVREEREGGDVRLYDLPIERRFSRLELDHLFDLHSAVLIDRQRGPLWYSPPGVFLRSVSINLNVEVAKRP